MKKLLSVFLAIALFAINVHAQFSITATEACIIGSELQVKGKITFPPSDFAICAYTVELYDLNKKKLADIAINVKTPQDGNYDFKGIIPASVSSGFPFNVKVTTNRQTSAWLTINSPCGAVRFKNRYTDNQWINIEKGAIAADAVQPAFLSAQWKLVPVAGTKFYRLESAWKAGVVIHIEKGKLEATPMQAGAWSAQWELEEVEEEREEGDPVYYRLKNRWKPELYLNTEKGKLECTAVPLAFQSANWQLERTW